MSKPKVVVYTTPPLTPLPASDSESIYLLATVRAGGINPGVQTADWAANGKAYVAQNDAAIPTGSLSYLSGWNDPDADLSPAQAADADVWKAYIDGQITDLVNHSLYSLPPNYPVISAAQLAACPFPTNLYVPQRLKGIVKARLDAVGLWGVGGLNYGDAAEEDRKRLEDSFVVGPGGTKTDRAWSGWNSGRETAERQRKFGEETILQRARTAFDPLVRKLGRDKFFFGSRPSSLDLALFSQLTLVLSTNLPNPLLSNLLRETYPVLVAHHDAVLSAVFPGGWGAVQRLAPPPQPSLVDSLRLSLPKAAGGGGESSSPEVAGADPDEVEKAKAKARQFAWGRYAWFAGAGIAFITYVLASGILAIDFGGDDLDYDEEEEEEHFSLPTFEDGEEDEVVL
ncbi:Metaxin-1 [Vanrija pseudolonga]|uniref:Metaxin-1 n=1 Tax=Vanrija pseudolonga TaxID=143232 RepID=A0AAF0Y6X5_9TREE|nr:Metaxin-1 [Vanrija pseudolonga]